MTPRPFHRWKSFWFGVLVLAFLGWAWARSMRHMDGIFWVAPAFSASAGQTTGCLSLAWDGSQSFVVHDRVWIHEPAHTTGEPLFPKAVNWETYDRQLQLTIAHWFLILLFLVPWAAFLLWHFRQMRRRASTAARDPRHP